jgi:hypothetical protein
MPERTKNMQVRIEDKDYMLLHVLCFDFCYTLVMEGFDQLDEVAKDLLRLLEQHSGETSEDDHEVITKLRDAIKAALPPHEAVEQQVGTRLDLILLAGQVFTTKNGEACKTAKLLDGYMRFRVKKEGVGYELLSPDFYRQEIEGAAKDLSRLLEQYSGETSEDEREVITKLRDAIKAVLARQGTVEEQVGNRRDLIMLAWQVFMKKNEEAWKTAKLLDAYMRFRAKEEGVSYELSPDCYRKESLVGGSDFFGIVVENGKLVCDNEQPRMFEQWEAKKSRLHDGLPELSEEDDAYELGSGSLRDELNAWYLAIEAYNKRNLPGFITYDNDALLNRSTKKSRR